MALLSFVPSRAFRSALAAAAVLLCLLRPGAAQDRPEALPEYVVKAGFLFNFAKYVEWPADAFEGADSPFVIGIAGKDPFGPDLEKTLQSKTVRGRAFSIQRFAEPSELQRCHILFVAKTEKGRLAEFLSKAAAWPVLTIGEEPDFARSGGAGNILIENEKPKLEINPEAAEKAKLTVSAKLLKAATLVRTSR